MFVVVQRYIQNQKRAPQETGFQDRVSNDAEKTWGLSMTNDMYFGIYYAPKRGLGGWGTGVPSAEALG